MKTKDKIKIQAQIRRLRKETEDKNYFINKNIPYAESMADLKVPEAINLKQKDAWAYAFITAMNFLLHAVGKRQLTKTEIKEATEMYG